MCPALPMITASSEFKAVAENGRRWVTPSFILQILIPNNKDAYRVGFTASRKVGGAVVRNRAKRRLREMVRLYARDNTLPAADFVLIAKTSAAERDFAMMQKDFVWALGKLSAPA